MLRRLFLGFLLCCFTAVACFYLLPRLGVNVPWFVPMIAFVAIAGATAMATAQQPREGDDPLTDAGAEDFAGQSEHDANDAEP